MPAETTPIPPWAPCKRPLGCDYPDCECHSQTTAYMRLSMEADYELYQSRLGNLTQREENAHRKAFTSGWIARDKAGQYDTLDEAADREGASVPLPPPCGL